MNKQTKNKIERKELPIKDLCLWENSPRLVFLEEGVERTQSEIMKYFCEKPKVSILGLAKAMVFNMDMPQREPLIAYGEKGDFTVIQGNRRLIVYKLLANPELAHNEEYRKAFLELRKMPHAAIDENFMVECLVSVEKEPLLPYLEE